MAIMLPTFPSGRMGVVEFRNSHMRLVSLLLPPLLHTVLEECLERDVVET